MSKDHKCRDCEKCTERGLSGLVKKAANATLIVSTLGTSALAMATVKGARRNCPKCGHPLAIHAKAANGQYVD